MSAQQADLDIGIGGGSDPFGTGKGRGKIHVRIQQRNGRKCITTIQGLDSDLDLGRIMKNMKKNCACGWQLPAFVWGRVPGLCAPAGVAPPLPAPRPPVHCDEQTLTSPCSVRLQLGWPLPPRPPPPLPCVELALT